MPRPPGRWVWFPIVAVALGALVVWLASGPAAPPGGHAGWARAAALAGFAALIAAGLLHRRRIGLGRAAGAVLFWVALGAVLVLAYGYRFELERAWQRLGAELLPHRAQVTGPGTLAVRRAADGHFYVTAEVNGAAVRFLVDTGASATVLDPEDTRRAGIDPARLAFTQRFHTANGTVRAAPVTLDRVEIGPVAFRNVRASVNAVPLGTSLMGVSMLARFRSWRVEDGTLSLSY